MKMNREIFEGKDYPTQWALNPSMYQNMSNDQVDWAALAQQWIKMKETVVPPAPPPPSLSNDSSNDGGGEAPMDMDTKDDDVPPAPPAPNISGADGWSQWSQWGSWNASAPGGACWEWTGVPPPGVTIGPDGKPMGIPSTVPTVSPAASHPSRSGSHSAHNASPYSYNSVSPVQPAFNSTMPGYWSADTTQNPPPFAKGMRHGSRMSHVRGDMMRNRGEKEKTPEEDTTTVLDAAKRRQLPAWIREGLEKMEREKHKAVERERQEMLRKQELIARKLAEDEARAVLNPAKSKFDSDSEKEAEEDSDIPSHVEDRNNLDASPDIMLRPRRSRFRDAGSPEARGVSANKEISPLSSPVNSNPPVKRSREEILQDVMLKVRRSLTEILLEVTNEEIANVCREVWERSRAKAPAGGTPTASLTNTAPLAQITRKLGLGIYGDSNSESDEEQENNQTEDDDSDAELKETLRRRQAAFKKTEEEIEARILEEEENEIRETEESNNHENDMGNDTTNDQVEEKDVNNDRELSESPSSPGTPPKPIDTRKIHKPRSHSSRSRSQDSESSSSTPSSSSSDSPSSDSSRSVKKRRKKKSKSRSPTRSRKSRSRSHSRDRRHREYRSRSSSRKSKRSRERKRRSREERSRSRSRRRSRSYSRRHSRHSRSRSRNRKHYSHSSSSKRRTRSKSKERRRSRSRSRGYRDGKKSSRRYRD